MLQASSIYDTHVGYRTDIICCNSFLSYDDDRHTDTYAHTDQLLEMGFSDSGVREIWKCINFATLKVWC